jgi:hypothetical protein
MRTRIALVAAGSAAVITVSLLSQLVSVQPARAATAAPRHPAAPAHRTDRLDALVTPGPTAVHHATAVPALKLGVALLLGKAAGTKEVAPVAPPAPVDTVTPGQRAAWERVAMCEEGGNWQADGPRFSGGLGITRANWAIYGGLQYASEGAMATEDQQIMVAERIQSSPPDQYGCSSW